MKNFKKNKPSQSDGVAVWFITDNCNYKCSYCFTSKSSIKVEDYDSFLKNIKNKIPRNWKFFIAGGGEPFTHPNFFKIIDGLVKFGYRLSINSNLSPSLNKLNRFFKIAGKNLDIFQVSLHLEHVQAQIFIKKILAFKKSFPDFKKIIVTTVARKDRMKEMEFVKKTFDKKIKLFFQPLRDKTQKAINYSPKEMDYFSFYPDQLDRILTGTLCNSGQKMIAILPTGDTFRCVTGLIKNHGYLGNILTDNLAFYDKPKPCEEEFCFCGNSYFRYKKIMNSE